MEGDTQRLRYGIFAALVSTQTPLTLQAICDFVKDYFKDRKAPTKKQVQVELQGYVGKGVLTLNDSTYSIA